MTDFTVTTSLINGETEAEQLVFVDKNILDGEAHIFIDNVVEEPDNGEGSLEGDVTITLYKAVTYDNGGTTDYRMQGNEDSVELITKTINIPIPSSPKLFVKSHDLTTLNWDKSKIDKVGVLVRIEAGTTPEVSFDTKFAFAGNTPPV